MTKAVFNDGSSVLSAGTSDTATDGAVNAFAGLPAQALADIATAGYALQPAFGAVPLQTAEIANHAATPGVAAAAASPPLDLFDLGEFQPGTTSSNSPRGDVIAPTAAHGYNIALVGVTQDGSGTYTVASGSFPTSAEGYSTPNAALGPLPKGAHGGDTFSASAAIAPLSGQHLYPAFNFFVSGGATNFSLVTYGESAGGQPVLTSNTVRGPMAFENVKVLGWNSDSILLSFASSTDTNVPGAQAGAGGGGDIVISGENMTSNPGSLPTNTTFTTTGAHPVINGTTVPCFAAGTRLATPRGEIAVEHLAPGDAVLTHDGRTDIITWIGTRTVACHAHPRPEKVWPVRVRRHAFGANLPKRDLILSPDHGVFVEGVLIPVCELINGSSVVQERVHAIRYLHVEFALHTIILAEGLPTESLLDLGDHRQFENGDGPMSLHADFTALAWEAACVPLKLHGPEVDAARALLARQMQAAA